MSCFIPRSPENMFPSPKAKRGWKHLMRTVRSKVPLVLRRFKVLNNAKYPSTRHYQYHNHNYLQYHYPAVYPYPDEKRLSSLSRMEMEGGRSRPENKALVFAPTPSVLMTRTSTSSSVDMDVHDHHVLEDGVYEKALGLEDVYYHITNHDDDQYAVSITNNTRSVATTTLQPLHGVDKKAEDFIKDFREFLALERQKSAEELSALLARST